MGSARRLPIGAELTAAGVELRVWAPRRTKVTVVLGSGARVELTPESGGYFAGVAKGVEAGMTYRLDVGDGRLYPDPASRAQPEGPHGPSQVVDPGRYRWNDGAWKGPDPRGQVIYELHVGTFSPEGTWEGAAKKLPELVELGVTTLEVMPVAEFPGKFGWGYDGVDLFAPTRLYGSPDDMRRFVDRAHQLGLAVILDVVYNHLGPDGNYLEVFGPYTTKKYPGEWGDPINFDGDDAAGVREFFVANAGYWIDEFHVDGLRVDATQCLHDDSREHIMIAITRRARAAAKGRAVYIVGENEPQQVRLLEEYGFDALWNDDFHHSARVAATGCTQAYYTDYEGTPQELVSAVKHGYLFQGQRYRWQGKNRGSPARGVAPRRFVHYLQNHDQIANTGFGERITAVTSPGRVRALTALLLLGPQTPLLFQGQEWAASARWRYFADHQAELAPLVKKGRNEFVTQFPSLADPASQARLPDPGDPATFASCRLDWSERDRPEHACWLALHKDLLRLRRALGHDGPADGAVLGPEAFAIRFEGAAGALLLVNLGRELVRWPIPEPLLAPPDGKRWAVAFSSEDPAYGGHGTAPVITDDGWRLPAHAAILLRPEAHEAA